MGTSKKGSQPAPEVDLDVPTEGPPGRGDLAKTTMYEDPSPSLRNRSGSLTSRLMKRLLPTAKMECQTPEIEAPVNYVARLKVKDIEAEGLLQCHDPYIICTYDHDEVFMIRENSNSQEVHVDERTHANIHRWGASCYL